MTGLREIRERNGLTAIELARRAGTREMRIYAFERERFRPKKNEACRIASVLGVSVDSLFPRTEHEQKGGEI